MMIETFRAQFPAAVRSPYFATNGYGLLPTGARDAVSDAVDRLAARGYAAHARLERDIEPVREHLAASIGARADEIGFVRNTADGIGFIAESLAVEPHDEVVVFDGDYGTVVYPFLAREARGELQVRVVPTAADGLVTVEEVRAAIGPRTRAVALSWVRFDSGARCDLDAIAAACRERGVWCIVDAIQGLGVFPIDVRAAGIDALAAGCHKWQCGLAGLGVLYLAAPRLTELRPTRAGLDAFDHPADYLSTGYPFTPRAVLARVEDGAKPEVAIAALGAALDLFDAAGRDAIRDQVYAVTQHLCDGWESVKGVVRSPRGAETWSGILALEPPRGLDAHELCGRLLAAGVMLGERDGALWIGAHAYTTISDADAVLSAVQPA
jgi:selenocysteine lyase/cysteine desulfurase